MIRSVGWIILAITSASISGCGYEGDGAYTEEGIWPLKNYQLILPDFELLPGAVNRYGLTGYQSHGRSLLRLKVSSERPVPFHELDTVVEVKVSDDLGTTYFYRNGPLNQHYSRMVSEGDGSYAKETEWFARYQYDDPEYDHRVVPFKSSAVPSELTEIIYSSFLPTGDRPLTLYVEVYGGSIEMAGLSAQISLSSGWK